MRKWQGTEGMTLLISWTILLHMKLLASLGLLTFFSFLPSSSSGALQIPLVRLMGQSPAGLNSAGESDLRTYL